MSFGKGNSVKDTRRTCEYRWQRNNVITDSVSKKTLKDWKMGSRNTQIEKTIYK